VGAKYEGRIVDYLWDFEFVPGDKLVDSNRVARAVRKVAYESFAPR
jgi:hypothetical protein